jgi:outer membrane protein OmpA-like peptidoglycan-associated protein
MPARAQPLDLTMFSPPPHPATAFTIPEPLPARHGSIHVGIASDVASGVLDRDVPCEPSRQPGDAACARGDQRASGRVPWTVHATLLAEVALFDAISIGAALPLAFARSEWNRAPLQNAAGIGDVTLSALGSFAATASTHVGWQVAVSVPTAAYVATFASDPKWTLWPSVILSQRIGRTVLSAQLGYHVRERRVVLGVEQDDELSLALGARHVLSRGVALLAELRARAGVGGRSFRREEAPAEIDLGVRLGSIRAGELDVGVGTRAWPGDRGLGAPELRAFLTLRRAFETASCTAADGCGDRDDDHDGIPNSADACPNDAEDRDGFEDDDGCPDLDNDADGRLDADDMCPDDSEDLDGFQDLDGCPEPDNDEDGIADGSDQCRLDPEDRDGFEDDDGCPEPGPGIPTVTVSGSRLLMSDRIYFEDESDTLRAVSTPALDAVAAAFKRLPGHPRLRVEGHTDDSGNPQYNIDLSYRRARAVVEYLKRQGIEADRLEYVGRGSADPLGPNTSPEGRALNRRVEFVLLDR